MDICYDHKLPTQHQQWFIAQNLVSHTQYFYSTIDSKQYNHECQLKELHGRRIRAYFHGWVVLSNHPDNVLWSIWNPLTSNFIRLPPLINKENHSYECCLSSPPDVQGSVLLLTTTKLPTIVFCQLDRKRKRLRWIEMSYAKQLRSISGVDDCLLRSPTCCNGKVYAMSLGFYYNFVIQVDIDVVKAGRQVVISLIPFVELPSTCYNRCPPFNSFQMMDAFLKGFCTDLFYISVCYKDETVVGDVYLFKLDATSMMWEAMLDLKNANFFLQFATDHPSCYYSSTVDSELEAGYVHILGKSGKVLYSFDVKDRTMSVSSLESQVSAWAMLEWRRFEFDQQQEEDTTLIVVKPVKVDNIDYDNTTGESSHMLNIPIHILEVIMELCVGIEYMRFRATCKHCRLAAPPVQWSNKTTLRRLQMYSLVSPWLMVLDNYRGIITFIDPLSGERYFIKKPRELKGDYQIFCSRFGWLLMFKPEDEPQLVFFNPFTSNIRKLPAVPYLENFCFSAPPTSSDCKVVGFTTYGQWHVYIHIVSGESQWNLFALNFGCDDPYSYHFPTFKGRDVYALFNNEGVDAFRDVTDADYSWEAVVDKAPISAFKSPAHYFLSSCDQHLLQVSVGNFGESVEVLKLNESTQDWDKIHGLGKHMIYISNTSCICLEAKSPEMGNKIYFPRLLHNKMVFYSLETNRYHTFDDKSIQESFSADLLTTKRHCHPHTWIEPSWS